MTSHRARTSLQRASTRQVPARPRRTRTRRATARDPLRAPPSGHGPPVHRRPQRARRLATHPAPRVTNRRLRRRVPAQPPRGRPRRDRPLAPRVRRDRRAGRARPTPRLPASADHDRVLGTRGHAHAYFTLSAPVTVPQLEQANRRLASCSRRRPRLGRRRPHPEAASFVESQALAAGASRADRARAVASIRRRPTRRRARRPARRAYPSMRLDARRTARTEIDRLLLAIPAAEYVRVIAGVSPNRAGKIHCPFHEDHTPSLQLYDDGTWYCYGPAGPAARSSTSARAPGTSAPGT